MTTTTSCNDRRHHGIDTSILLYYEMGVVSNETIGKQIPLTKKVESCLKKAVNHYTPPRRLLHKDKVSDEDKPKKASNTISATEEARKKERKAVEPLPRHTRFDAGDIRD